VISIARALIVCGFAANAAHAQTGATSSSSAVLLSGSDLAWLGIATAGAVASTRFDVRIAHAFADSGFHLRHPGFTTAAKRTSLVTETVLMITSSSTWAVARLAHDRATADVAFHTFEGIAAGASFIQVVRGALGRARPYVIDDAGDRRDADPYEFQLLHGFTSFNYRSFPSMHAMASLAAASALAQEMRITHAPLRAEIAPLLYTAATMPSLARMYLDEHWTSDIVMGAFLGVFAGQKAVLYSHANPNNWADRKFLPSQVRAAVVRDAGGLRFVLAPF
jgi:membrane-associated phospholipid phosphatase